MPSSRRGAGTDPLRGVGSRRRSTSSNASKPAAATADSRAARARELHEKALAADVLAARQRAERDRLILQLRAEDPDRWSYTTLARALGCSRELIALVVRRHT